MSDQRNSEPKSGDPGRSSDRARQDRTLRHAIRSESWLEQLQRIAKEAKGKPAARD